jgi:hypothetical protein
VCHDEQIPVPREQIFTIDASLSPAAMAVDYTSKLATVWGDQVRAAGGPDDRRRV